MDLSKFYEDLTVSDEVRDLRLDTVTRSVSTLIWT